MSTEHPGTTDIAVVDLDCTGSLCPLPVYKAALALGKLRAGDRLRLTTTDPGALEDIPAMTRQRGDTLVLSEITEGGQTFIIEKGTQR